jgi:MFS superfamily sulfate permease-like transporter
MIEMVVGMQMLVIVLVLMNVLVGVLSREAPHNLFNARRRLLLAGIVQCILHFSRLPFVVRIFQGLKRYV